jgi:lipopolysaccharide/colanic/teichoic acid biosynthesis glycosyltransferase
MKMMKRRGAAAGGALDGGGRGHQPDRAPASALAAGSAGAPGRVAPLGPGAAALKRALDTVVALGLLIATSPLMAVLAVLIKRESPGPAIFGQWRLGQGCQPFRFYKFRTMYADWPTRYPELAAFAFDMNRLEEVFLQREEDPRVTPLGRHLRRTSLDELPNLWNILVGQMSLVGPRPELPEMLPYYAMRDKFDVKPGLTGWAQIRGRGELNFPDTLALDLEYVRRRSLLLDLRILAETAKAVVIGRGAY